MWRFGGGDWLEVFRVFNGLGQDLRPVGQPNAVPALPLSTQRYRHFLYACAKEAARIDEGLEESRAQDIRSLKREDISRSSATRSVTGKAASGRR